MIAADSAKRITQCRLKNINTIVTEYFWYPKSQDFGLLRWRPNSHEFGYRDLAVFEVTAP